RATDLATSASGARAGGQQDRRGIAHGESPFVWLIDVQSGGGMRRAVGAIRQRQGDVAAVVDEYVAVAGAVEAGEAVRQNDVIEVVLGAEARQVRRLRPGCAEVRAEEGAQ